LNQSSRNKEGLDPFLFAIDCEFSIDTLKFLLETGFSPDTQDEEGRTPLHYAVDLENKDLIKFLLKNGANPYKVDKDGSSPIDEAAYIEECIVLLK
jgi:ankyrin repeat protein